MVAGRMSAETSDRSGKASVRQSLSHRLPGVRPVGAAPAGLHPVPEHAEHQPAAAGRAADQGGRRPGATAAAASPHLRPAADGGDGRHPGGSGGRRQIQPPRRVPLAGADPLLRPEDRMAAHVWRRHHQRSVRPHSRPLHAGEGAQPIRGRLNLAERQTMLINNN